MEDSKILSKDNCWLSKGSGKSYMAYSIMNSLQDIVIHDQRAFSLAWDDRISDLVKDMLRQPKNPNLDPNLQWNRMEPGATPEMAVRGESFLTLVRFLRESEEWDVYHTATFSGVPERVRHASLDPDRQRHLDDIEKTQRKWQAKLFRLPERK